MPRSRLTTGAGYGRPLFDADGMAVVTCLVAWRGLLPSTSGAVSMSDARFPLLNALTMLVQKDGRQKEKRL